MDCIPYINDLELEIKILKDLQKSGSDNAESINEQLEKKKELLSKCKANMNKLSGNSIYYRIYIKLLDGVNPTRALEEVAEENANKNIKPSSTASLWIYYRKLKKVLKF